MRKILLLILISAILLTMAFSSHAIPAKEDTAQLTFSKTAISEKSVYKYRIQEGDVLSSIVRQIPGITEKKIPHYYRMIQEMNPQIKDLNKLYAGQKIVLPGKIATDAKEKTAKADIAAQPQTSGTASPQVYHVKRGDNLIRIAHRVLHVKSNTQKTLLLIQALNPAIKNANKIYIGQMIHLPEGQLLAEQGSQSTQKTNNIEESNQVVSSQEEPPKENAKESIILPPEARLAVIKHVITQMNGTMLTRGSYYLPFSKTEQLTIDCSLIPVVELDDRTTIFLDFGKHSGKHLKKIINDNWKNYHLAKIDAKDDVIAVLNKIFENSKTYEISKAQNPVVIGSMPSLEVIMDWLITRKDSKKSSQKTQGLRFVYENNALLPRAIVNYARSHSFIITEISPKTGLVGKPEEIYSLSPMTVLSTSSARDFTYDLLSYLNIPAEKDVDVAVFNINQDGFNLSIKADIAVTRQEKKTIIFSRHLPPQFVNILQKAGNELIFISNQDEPVKNMEKILQGFHFVFANGYFTFSGLDKNQPPYHLGFNGIKIKTDKITYVVNSDFNQDLRGLMQEVWSANVIRH